MKKGLVAAVFSTALLFGTMPVQAAYESVDEIALSLRPMTCGEGVYIPDDAQNRVYVSPDAAVEGTTVHFGVYIEAERAEICFLSMMVQSDCDTITLNKNTFQKPNVIINELGNTYTLPDGQTFNSRWKPYCLGTLSSSGTYSPSCYMMDTNFIEEQNAMRLTWMYGIGNATSFLGGTSDSYTFIDVDAEIAPGTQPGIYHLSFIADDSISISQSPTYISSDESKGGASAYSDIIPTLKNAEIIVGSSSLDNEETAFRTSEDTTAFTAQDFSGNVRQLSANGFRTVPLTTDGMTLLSPVSTPSDMGVTVPQVITAQLEYEGLPVLTPSGKPAEVQYRVGLRGDANMDGSTNASDAAVMLIYAAEYGSSGDAALADNADDEAFVQYLANVNRDAQVNASDAACTLIYAAVAGSGSTPDWSQILKN